MVQEWITNPQKLDRLYLEGIKHILAIEAIVTRHLVSKNNSQRSLEEIYVEVGEIVKNWIFTTDNDFPSKGVYLPWLKFTVGELKRYFKEELEAPSFKQIAVRDIKQRIDKQPISSEKKEQFHATLNALQQQYLEQQFADFSFEQKKELLEHRQRFQNIFPEVSQSDLGQLALTHGLVTRDAYPNNTIFEAVIENVSKKRTQMNRPPLTADEIETIRFMVDWDLLYVRKDFLEDRELKEIKRYRRNPEFLKEIEKKREKILAIIAEVREALPRMPGGIEMLTYLPKKSKLNGLFKGRVIKIPHDMHTTDGNPSRLLVHSFQRGYAPINNNPNLTPSYVFGMSALLSDEILQALLQNAYAREDRRGLFVRTEMCWCRDENGNGTIVYHQEAMQRFNSYDKRHRRAIDQLYKRSRSEWTRRCKLSQIQRKNQREVLRDVLYPAENMQGDLVAIGVCDGHHGNLGFLHKHPKFFDALSALVRLEEYPQLKSYFERLKEIPKKKRFLPEPHAYQAYEEARNFLGKMRQRDIGRYRKFNAAYSTLFPAPISAPQLITFGRVHNEYIFQKGQEIARSHGKMKRAA